MQGVAVVYQKTKAMKIKVCGMREPENIRALAKLPIDWMGLIFYDRSPRFAGNLPPDALACLPGLVKRAGVFVNQPAQVILEKVKTYSLATVQLHGAETPDVCRELKQNGLEVIKAFAIAKGSDFAVCKDYEAVCDYFLFDTKSPNYGGTGLQFNWLLLKHYTGNTPFLLSGGIGKESAGEIKKIAHNRLAGIDLNSRFETTPGVKETTKINQFRKEIKS